MASAVRHEGARKIRLGQIRAGEVRATQVRAVEIRRGQIGIAQVSAAQVRFVRNARPSRGQAASARKRAKWNGRCVASLHRGSDLL